MEGIIDKLKIVRNYIDTNIENLLLVRSKFWFAKTLVRNVDDVYKNFAKTGKYAAGNAIVTPSDDDQLFRRVAENQQFRKKWKNRVCLCWTMPQKTQNR